MYIALFWLSLAILTYVYVGYPMILWLAGRFISRSIYKLEIYPYVSIVIAVYNEEDVIARKIENCLQLDYPRERLEIIVGSDCSSDATDSILQSYEDYEVKCFRLKERLGKVGVLNEIVPKAKGEIILFTDARQIFDVKAIKNLVCNFSDKTVGCVGGELILLDNNRSTVAKGLGLYWYYEKIIRKLESEISSMVGATGAIYAIRKELYVPPSIDIILDDVYIPMKVVEQGYRAVFEPAAIAYDEISKTIQVESKRKVRTLAGNWQLLFKLWNNFRKYDLWFSTQVISHKFLRLIAPVFIVVLFLSSLFLITRNTIYKVIFTLQIFFYVFAFLNIIFKSYRLIIFSIPYTFCALNIDAVRGFFNFVRKEHKSMWK